MVSILLYSLSLVGMMAVIGYTGLGLSLWPIRLLRGQESVQEQREDVRQERRRVQLQINTMRDQVRERGRSGRMVDWRPSNREGQCGQIRLSWVAV